MVGQVVEVDFLAGEQRMPLTAVDPAAVAADGGRGQRGVPDGLGGQREVELAAKESTCELRLRTHLEDREQGRVLPMHADERRQQIHSRHCAWCGNANFATQCSRVDRRQGIVDHTHRIARCGEQRRAGARQRQSTADAFEQRGGDVVLEQTHAARQGRRGDVKAFGGAPQMLGLADCPKRGQPRP